MKRSVGSLALLLPLTTLVGAAVAGAFVGIEVSLLVVAGGALLGVIALIWASVQSLTGESPLTLEEALSLGAPSAEEEQKRAVLRALKDLEFERGVGKITQEDYVELSTRYRAEARRLMHALDTGGEKERAAIEQALTERLAAKERKALEVQPKPGGAVDASDPEAAEVSSTKHAAPRSEPEPAEDAPSDPKTAVKAVEGEGA
jgi:hypothetical protein